MTWLLNSLPLSSKMEQLVVGGCYYREIDDGLFSGFKETVRRHRRVCQAKKARGGLSDGGPLRPLLESLLLAFGLLARGLLRQCVGF